MQTLMDNPGELKLKQESAESSSNPTQNITLRNREVLIFQLADRAKKVVVAFYMVTDLMDQNEPIRLRLRSIGISTLSHLETFPILDGREKNLCLEQLSVCLGEALSLIEIGALTGLVSPMNGAILKREAGIIKNKIASLAEAYSQANFNRSEKKAFNDFSVSSIFESRTDKPDQLSESLNINEQVDNYNGHQYQKDKAQIPIKDNVNNKRTEVAFKIARRNDIIRIIKDIKEATIKDIAKLIPSLSEKTIQRELMALVSEGVLQKIGKKRWSKYSLIQA